MPGPHDSIVRFLSKIALFVYYLAWLGIVTATACLLLPFCESRRLLYGAYGDYPVNAIDPFVALAVGLALFFPIGRCLRYVRPWHWVTVACGILGIVGSCTMAVLGGDLAPVLCLMFGLPFFCIVLLAGIMGLVISRRRLSASEWLSCMVGPSRR
jgi:hypothetical protein